MLSAIKPIDGNKATPGNGTMLSIAAKDADEVNLIYQTAIALGAKDEGPAGPRGERFMLAIFGIWMATSFAHTLPGECKS